MNSARSQALTIGEATTALFENERLMRSIAQQVARDLIPINDIITLHGITPEDFVTLRGNHAFNAMVIEEMAAWKDIGNAPERIKHRYLTMLEMSASEFFEALIDKKVHIKDRTDLLKVIMRGANIGNEAPQGAAANAGNKVNIVINMGTATFSVTGLPSRVIDSSVNRNEPHPEPDGYMTQEDPEDIQFVQDTDVGWLEYDEENTPDYRYLIKDEANG